MSITSAFGRNSTAAEVIAGHDLGGKTALVTGASSGIGIETARALLSANAEVILAVRDSTKGEKVARELRASTGNSRVHVLPLDLGSLAAVRQAAAEFYRHWSKLDLLINNAGIMATPLSYTPDGYEQQFGTNYLGHFLLTALLLPALEKAAPARVVIVSSGLHSVSDIDFEDINFRQRPYDKDVAYAQSKTASILFAVALTNHYASRGVTANALTPGVIRTGLQKFLSQEEQRALGWIDEKGNPVNTTLRWKTPEQGAATSVWVGVAPELEGIGGRYFENCNELEPGAPTQAGSRGLKPYAVDPGNAERLWTLSEEMVGWHE
ncbi:MAG: SDR family NAD(P)-dependent oxidoreductase [Chloroflexi bacterium]|nr:SDR family NAD(P)-dependent oxidoreductase [Chloroflexota bacterium]OJV92505.1 MAG: oxidoreductase [Chloroflexi bacterium 54-19]